MTIELKNIQELMDKVKDEGYRYPEIIVSPKAYKLCERILEISPNFVPVNEPHIWAKARELGLTDEI